MYVSISLYNIHIYIYRSMTYLSMHTCLHTYMRKKSVCIHVHTHSHAAHLLRNTGMNSAGNQCVLRRKVINNAPAKQHH